eukprot:7122357-Pyramimonas_sp.AAC.1
MPPRARSSARRATCCGWATGRRVQRPARRAYARARGEDCVEHYIHCPKGRAVRAQAAGVGYVSLTPRFSRS